MPTSFEEKSARASIRNFSTEDRFFQYTDVDIKTGCWPWVGAYHKKQGYGLLWADDAAHRAHRVAYTLFKGKIPEGLVIDHLCGNRICVNPFHLEAVTDVENIRRGKAGAAQRNKTHCPKGHPYSGENLIIIPINRGNKINRVCRICRKDIERRYRERKQGKL